MSTLRDAVEALAATRTAVSGDALRDLLAAHPDVDEIEILRTALREWQAFGDRVKPMLDAPVVTDEAVQSGAQALEAWAFPRPAVHLSRKILEAAAPLLGPRPLLDDGGVYRIVGDHDITDAVMELARPMPTREQIEGEISDELYGEGILPDFLAPKLARRVIDLLNGAES